MRRVPSVAPVILAVLGAAPAYAEDPGEVELARRIRGALDKATRELARVELGDGKRNPNGKAARPLIALALLRAGNADERRVARALVDAWWEEHVKPGAPAPNTYELALEISALEALSLERISEEPPRTVSRYEAKPVEAMIKDRLERATAALIEGRVKLDGGECAWSYNCVPIPAGGTVPKRRTVRDDVGGALRRRMGGYDNSNTQFAVLALHDAARAGVAPPRDVVLEIAKHFVSSAVPAAAGPVPPGKTPTGPAALGFGYADEGRARPSMTCAGLSSLAIVRELGANDPDVTAAIGGVRASLPFVVQQLRRFPLAGRGSGGSYGLYSLEKALDLLELRELDGRPWFPPLASTVLDAQGEDGFWIDATDTSLLVLFLARATVSKARVKDSRATGGGGSPQGDGAVYLASSKKVVDAVALIEAYGASGKGRLAAEEAIRAIEAEGHGREACLLAPLLRVAEAGGDPGEQAGKWIRDLCGRAVPRPLLAEEVALYTRPDVARDPAALRRALGAEHLLPIRAWAAMALAALPCPEATADVIASARELARDKLLETRAGSSAARALADALTGLTQAALPPLPPRGPVTFAQLAAVAAAAAEKAHARVATAAARAVEAHGRRAGDPAAWESAKRDLAAAGRPGLERLLDLTREPARAPAAFALLRALTGELIPDDADVWRAYLSAR